MSNKTSLSTNALSPLTIYTLFMSKTIINMNQCLYPHYTLLMYNRLSSNSSSPLTIYTLFMSKTIININQCFHPQDTLLMYNKQTIEQCLFHTLFMFKTIISINQCFYLQDTLLMYNRLSTNASSPLPIYTLFMSKTINITTYITFSYCPIKYHYISINDSLVELHSLDVE